MSAPAAPGTSAPPGRRLAVCRAWMGEGTATFRRVVRGLGDADFAAPSALAGWTRAHLVAHVAANADALGNLVTWARTGIPTPMYSSAGQRDHDIEAGSTRAPGDLVTWLEQSAAHLDTALAGLTDDQWQAQVVTAQGRTVAATEIPWLRARELLVHAVDLGVDVGFADLPADFLAALVTDIAGKRSAAADGAALVVAPDDQPYRWDVAGAGDPATVTGPLAALAAYLAGRAQTRVCRADGTPAPDLPRWL